MRTSVLAMAALWACTTVPAAAADQQDSQQASSSQGSDRQAQPSGSHADKNRKVCRMETSTGSVMPKRVCHTVAEMEALQAQAVAAKDALQDRR